MSYKHYNHDVEAEIFAGLIILEVEAEEMTLTQEQAKEVHRVLGHFIETGELPE